MLTEEQKTGLNRMITGEVRYDEPLSNHSTIKIGGKADAFVIPADSEGFVRVLMFAMEGEIEAFILGAGSNVLFRDAGFEGIIISTAQLNHFEVKAKDKEGLWVEAESGVLLSEMVVLSLEESVSGFEYLAGIPGTVGGALSMNAGTHEGAVSGPLVKVSAVDKAGRLYTWPKEKIEFGYRLARFPKSCVILSAEFFLKTDSKDEIGKRILSLKEMRKARHPLVFPSLGSIFKNPRKGPSAGELIEEAGLKGVRVGGARIAKEHGNWIVNENGATANDVEILIHLVREKVKETADVLLETEIVIVGNK